MESPEGQCGEKILQRLAALEGQIRQLQLQASCQSFARLRCAADGRRGKGRFKRCAVLFRYDYVVRSGFRHGVNLGDYVQTAAVKSVLEALFPGVEFTWWDRDFLSYYSGRPAFAVMQGWFSDAPSYLPNGGVLPVFIGTHITPQGGLSSSTTAKPTPRIFQKQPLGAGTRRPWILYGGWAFPVI